MKNIILLLLALSVPIYVKAVPENAVALIPATVKPKIDPAAFESLERSAKAYAALQSFSVSFDKSTSDVVDGRFLFEKPGKAKLTARSGNSLVQSVVDGTKIYSANQSAQYITGTEFDYVSHPLPRVLEMFPSPLAHTLPTLLYGGNPVDASETSQWDSVTLLCENGLTIGYRDRLGTTIQNRFYLREGDALLRRVELERTSQLFWATFSDIKTNPRLTSESLRFTPPISAKPKVVSLLHHAALKLGSVAPALQGIDLAKYRGKVVLLQFWKPDHPHSDFRLEDMRRVYDTYHERGLESIRIYTGTDEKQMRAIVEARNLPDHHILDSRIPKSSNAARYSFRGVPICFVIERQGKIAAIYPRGTRLHKVIKTLLEG